MQGDDLEVVIRRTWHPKQRVVVDLNASGTKYDRPVPEVLRELLKQPNIETIFIGGDFGGGKTGVASDRFLDVCLDNPFEEGIHTKDDHPLSAIVAPTLSDAKKSVLPQFRAVAKDLIDSERMYGEYQDITLINGHRIFVLGAAGALNGPTCCQVWVDELQESVFDGKWIGIASRARDKRARRLNVQATGIARRGNHVERLFGGLPVLTEDDFVKFRIGGDTAAACRRFYRSLSPEQHNVIRGRVDVDDDGTARSRFSVFLYPEDNVKNLAKGYAKGIRHESFRPRDAAGWLLQAEGVVYPEFSFDRNVVELAPMEELLLEPTSFAVDFGHRGAVAFGQPRDVPLGGDKKARGLYIVDELMPSNLDSEKMAAWIKRVSPWRIVAGKSKIILDPTAEADQVRDFNHMFPGVEVVQFKDGLYYLEENGQRAVQRGLFDAKGDTRIYVHPRLAERDEDRDPEGRGIVPMFGEYLMKKLKDHFFEHAADVVRYLTAQYSPLPEQDFAPSNVAPKQPMTASPWHFGRPSSQLRGGVVGPGSRWRR
jgi:hypothetical protein